MDVVDLSPLTDDAIDALGASAFTDYEKHHITAVRPRALLCLLAEVKSARLAALSTEDRATLGTIRDLLTVVQTECGNGDPDRAKGHAAATRGLAVLEKLLGGGSQ